MQRKQDCTETALENTESITSEDSTMSVEGIDLSLAVNYLPAVQCVAKGTLISCLLVIISPGEHLGVFIITALLLNVDRVLSSFRIFDGNSLLCTMLSGHVVNHLRGELEEVSGFWYAMTYISTLLWIIFALIILIEPEFYTEYLSSRGCIRRVHAALGTGLGVASVAFSHLTAESAGVRFMRSLSFLLLCVAWVYVIGVWKRSRVSSQLLVARFCPLLFVNVILSAIFGLFSVVYLIFYYSKEHGGTSSGKKVVVNPQQEYAKCVSVHVDQGNTNVVPGALNQTTGNEEEDLEVYFKLACQAKGMPDLNVDGISGRIGT